jgi:3-oxocholest-4-en-26-oate---CoA ligase
MEMHAATVFESLADAIGDAPALIHGNIRRSWSEYDQRSARLAAAFVDAGLAPDSKIGMYLYNSPEYMETQYAGFKMRGVPVNVNYRYLDDELWYLLDNADAEAIVFHSSLGDRVSRVAERLPKLRLLVEVDDGDAGQVPGAVSFESLISSNDPMPRITRAEDDVYMLYTGGTTGMPKGVMYAMGGLTAGFIDGGFPLVGLTPPKDAAQVAPVIADALASGAPLAISIPGCPLMHGTGMWLGGLIPHLAGGTIITLQKRNFDAHEMFATAAVEGATNLVVVGDSFVKPMIRTLDEAIEAGTPYDTSSLKIVISSGVMWTSEVKEALLDRIPQVVLLDAIGSSEGSMGMQITMRGMPAETAKFTRSPATKVFTEDDREVEPGSGEVGMVAAGGNVPIGYYKDEEKSARTFRVINGERYSFPGDLATVNEDGSLALLGRGSQVINSAGEKIFPEEVEEAVKRTEGVLDCLVVGVDDEKFGQAVTAVASTVDGVVVDEATVIASVKGQLSGFKSPKRVVFVATVPRAPNGKADYKAAKQLALDALGMS